MKSINWPKPGYASITCSTISNIPYNLIFTTKFNDSSILIAIMSCDYLNLSLAHEHVGDVTIPAQVIEYNKNFSRRISLSDWNIQIKWNYCKLYTVKSAQMILFRPRLFKWRNIVLSPAHQHSNDSNNSTMRVHSTTMLYILCKILFR